MALPATKDDGAPRASRTYEVQRYSYGRWTVDTVSDDKEVAIELAKSVMSGRRPPSGVRVMAVELRDDGKFSEVSVYRSTMIDQARAEPQPPNRKPRPRRRRRTRPAISSAARTDAKKRRKADSKACCAPCNSLLAWLSRWPRYKRCIC